MSHDLKDEDVQKLTDTQLSELEQALDAATAPAPETPLMTMNEARVAIAQQLNAVLAGAVQAVLEAQEQDQSKETNAYKNGTSMQLAAQEFIQANNIIIKRCRPARVITTASGMKVPLRRGRLS